MIIGPAIALLDDRVRFWFRELDMISAEESVLPETAPKLAAARQIPHLAWSPPYANIGSVLRRWFEETPDSNYLTFCDGDCRQSYSYLEFTNIVLQTSSFMRSGDLKLQSGDRIPQHPESRIPRQ